MSCDKHKQTMQVCHVTNTNNACMSCDKHKQTIHICHVTNTNKKCMYVMWQAQTNNACTSHDKHKHTISISYRGWRTLGFPTLKLKFPHQALLTSAIRSYYFSHPKSILSPTLPSQSVWKHRQCMYMCICTTTGLYTPKEKRACNLVQCTWQIGAKNSNTMYYHQYLYTKAVIVTNCSNVLLPLLNFAAYTVY